MTLCINVLCLSISFVDNFYYILLITFGSEFVMFGLIFVRQRAGRRPVEAILPLHDGGGRKSGNKVYKKTKLNIGVRIGLNIGVRIG